MATVCPGRRAVAFATRSFSYSRPTPNISIASRQCRRSLQNSVNKPKAPDFAFAFDIDGVLLRSSKALPRAKHALSYLQRHRIPFILLTNGGGKHESERVAELSDCLEVPLDTDMFIQSHTPFAELVNGKGNQAPLKDKCVLVTGGDGDKCRQVAENYGFTNVITPADLITAFPTLWPFASPTNYLAYARPLRQTTLSPKDLATASESHVKVDAIFIFNDPRDWALDTQIILDLLLSKGGYLGSLSSKNNTRSLPNRGYLQDGQPPLYFSNPDLLWAAAYHLPRLGQGGFREAFEGVWEAITSNDDGAEVGLEMRMFGKPFRGTYEFAEKRLQAHRNALLGLGKGEGATDGLKRVYMVGDNPESDILGANQYQSAAGSKWNSILVRSGVYSQGEPAHPPKTIVDNVWDAVEWGLRDSGWDNITHE